MQRFDLVGVDGNAFSIMAYTRNAMKTAKFSREEIDNYAKDCMRGNYDELLARSIDIIDECNDRLGLKEAEDDLYDEDDDCEEDE